MYIADWNKQIYVTVKVIFQIINLFSIHTLSSLTYSNPQLILKLWIIKHFAGLLE
jgi:hypothetical protein